MKIDIIQLKEELKKLNIDIDKYELNEICESENKLISFCIKNKIDISKIFIEYDSFNKVIDYVNKETLIDTKEISNIKNNFNSVELFAGAGGLLLGFEKAGFTTLGAVEIDKHSCNTLKFNSPNLNVINKDIEEVALTGIKSYLNNNIDVDILTGGFPCQSFSYAGKKLGMLDTRGTLFYWYAQILNQLRPKMFIAENVRGLVSHEQGKTLQTMINIFEEEGYNVSYKILNANDYNVAQKRQRIFIVGIRNDLYTGPFEFPKPLDYKPVLKDVLRQVPKSEGKQYPDKKKNVLDLVPPGGCWRNLPIEIQKDYMKKSFYLGGGKTGMARRLSWDEPSLTLTTSPDMKQTERCHPDETRPFTTREYARIQSFPDSGEFIGPITSIYTQIGNAVPVNLAYYVGLAVKHYLETMDI